MDNIISDETIKSTNKITVKTNFKTKNLTNTKNSAIILYIINSRRLP